MNSPRPNLPTNTTEFIGTAVLDTIGLLIPNIDPALQAHTGYDPRYRSLGVFSSRTGAAGQIMAVDEAVKATNCEILTIELPRDTKGWGGHGNYIVLGSESVSDVRRAIEISLELTNVNAGELYISQAGHLEFAYSARAGAALAQAFDVPYGQPFGFICGSPAAIGLVIADTAVKASHVEIVKYMTPNIGTSHSNEVIIAVTGDASSVKEAVITARETGLQLLNSMGSIAESPTGIPYL